MESLKTKYDRILLGTFGVIALAIGALVLMKVFTFEKAPPPPPAGKQSAELGDDKSADVARTLAALADEVVRSPKVLEGGGEADLMVSAPALKMSNGSVVNIVDPAEPQVRPPIDNKWLYDNGLDITQVDIASEDTDGDGFTNAQEFLGKSNPRNRADTPPAYTKLKYVETIEEPLTLRFSNYRESAGDFQLIRVEPNPRTHFRFKVGETFDHDERFKAVRVEMREVTSGDVTKPKPFLFLSDSENPDAPPIELEEGVSKPLPTLKGKLVDGLSGDEIVAEKDKEFSMPGLPGIKYLVTEVTHEAVSLSFIPQGGTERIQVQIPIADQ